MNFGQLIVLHLSDAVGVEIAKLHNGRVREIPWVRSMPDHLRNSLIAASPSQAVSEIAEGKVAGLAASLGLAEDMDTGACHI